MLSAVGNEFCIFNIRLTLLKIANTPLYGSAALVLSIITAATLASAKSGNSG